jgi:hypothetical protein
MAENIRISMAKTSMGIFWLAKINPGEKARDHESERRK